MKITLKNVRLSFPSIFKPKAINEGDPRYSSSFLLNKIDDASQIDALRRAVAQVGKEKWAGKIPKGIKYCVHDGSEKDYDGYSDKIIFVSASNEIRPVVVNRDRTPLTAEDGKPYAGCYVNAVIRLWAQDNNFGKRVNAQLCGIQFFRDGEAFGEKPFNAAEEFEKIEEAGADDAGDDFTAGAGDKGGDEEGSDIPF